MNDRKSAIISRKHIKFDNLLPNSIYYKCRMVADGHEKWVGFCADRERKNVFGAIYGAAAGAVCQLF